VIVVGALVLAVFFVPLPHVSLFKRLVTPAKSHASTGVSTTASSTVPTTSTATSTLLAGVDEASAWVLSESGLSVSEDGGQTWSDVALPGGVSADAVASIVQTPSQELWLATVDGSNVELYHEGSPTSSSPAWSNTALVASWPSGLGPMAPNEVTITPGPSGLVTVLVSDQLTVTTSVPRLFVSTNDGTTFQQYSMPLQSDLNTPWAAETFITPSSGVVVAGPAMKELFYTADGGMSWSPSSIAGLPTGVTVMFGTPFAEGSDIELPVVESTSDGGETVSLYVSQDDGATFSGPIGNILTVQGTFDQSSLQMAVYGQTIWLAPSSGGEIYETANNGQTWTSVTTSSLPAAVLAISLKSATMGTAIIGSGSCAQIKADCTQDRQFVVTTDGGQTWAQPS
jgi:photosystem II stability/assembly factor-like uncharacterized protein